jgi:hypothetical protein
MVRRGREARGDPGQRGNSARGGLRLATGKPGGHRDKARYAVIAGVGPRATPTIVDGRVYTMERTGI